MIGKRSVLIAILSILLAPLAGTTHAASRQDQHADQQKTDQSNIARQPQTAAASPQNPAILVAFIGGLLHHKVEHYQELEQRLIDQYGDQIKVEIVFNGARDRRRAMRAVRQWLDTDGDKNLSELEKRKARIALFGHSYGAAAEISFARELEKQNIPVLLTIQVDDIEKIGESGRVVPANVAKAANFYQRRGVLKGLPEIQAEDPAHTEIIGNFEVPYNPQVAESCKDYSKFLRWTDRSHIAIECDPAVGARIEKMIGETLFPKVSRLEQSKGN